MRSGPRSKIIRVIDLPPSDLVKSIQQDIVVATGMLNSVRMRLLILDYRDGTGSRPMHAVEGSLASLALAQARLFEIAESHGDPMRTSPPG